MNIQKFSTVIALLINLAFIAAMDETKKQDAKNESNDTFSSHEFYELLKISNSSDVVLKNMRTPNENLLENEENNCAAALINIDVTVADPFGYQYYKKAGKKLFMNLFNENRKGESEISDINVSCTNDYDFIILFNELITPLKNKRDEMIYYMDNNERVSETQRRGDYNKTQVRKNIYSTEEISHGCDNCTYNTTSQNIANTASHTINDTKNRTEKNNSASSFPQIDDTLQVAIHKIGILLSALIHFTNFEDKLNLFLDSTVFNNLLNEPNYIELGSQKKQILDFAQTIKSKPGLEQQSVEEMSYYLKQQVSNVGYNDQKKYVLEIIVKAQMQIIDNIWNITRNELLKNNGIKNLPSSFYMTIDAFFNKLHSGHISLDKLPIFIEKEICSQFFIAPSEITCKKISFLCHCICRIKFFVCVFTSSCDVGKYANVCQAIRGLLKDIYKVYCDRITIKNSKLTKDFTPLRTIIKENELAIKNKIQSMCSSLFYMTSTVYSIPNIDNEDEITNWCDDIVESNSSYFYYLFKDVCNKSGLSSDFIDYVTVFFIQAYK